MSQGLSEQVQGLELGNQYRKDITTMLTLLQKYQGKKQYGMAEDELWVPVNEPTDDGVARYKLNQIKAIQTVKTRITHISSDLVKLSRNLEAAQKATYKHATVKRRHREFKSSQSVRLKHRVAAAKQARRDKAAEQESAPPSLAALLAEDDDVDSIFELPDLS